MGISHRNRLRLPCMAAASAALLAPGPAIAQSIAPTREELAGVTQPPPQQRPTLNIVGGVERSPCPLADPRYADVRVTIRQVEFNGLKGASQDDMRAAWAPYAGTDQPVSVLCEIRDAAATILRNRGYLAAVQVPTQRIQDGEDRLSNGVHLAVAVDDGELALRLVVFVDRINLLVERDEALAHNLFAYVWSA